MQLGRAVGARAILVRTGNGAAEERQPPEGVTADVVVDNLAAQRLESDQSRICSEMLIARSVHPLPGEAERKERLLALVDGFSSRRVLVVGDLIADEFIYGEVSRVSREAPVLILKYDATQMVAGGAGNAANNVAALGGRARLSGLVGTDAEGRRLLASFARGVEKTHVVRAREYRTPVKTRILAGGVHAARAAGRAHRSRHRLAARRIGEPRRSRRRSSRRSTAATRCCCRTTAPGW